MAPFDPISRILAATALYPVLEDPARGRLLASAELRQAPAGSFLFQQGDPCPGVIVVGSGQVRVVQLAPNGKEHLLRLVEEGDSFAEVAVIGGFACPASAQAAEAVEYVLLPTAVVRELIAQDHGFCRRLLMNLACRVRSLVGLMEDVVLRDAVGRIARHLVEHGDRATGEIHLPGSKKDLASHLNLTPETFSRALRRLREHGLIGEQGASICIRDRRGLDLAMSGMYPEL